MKLVIALGSNDIIYGRTAEEVVTDILALRTRALEAVPCLHVYIAFPATPFGAGCAGCHR